MEKMKDARVVKRRTERKGEGVMHGEQKGAGESPEGEDETSRTPHFRIYIYKKKYVCVYKIKNLRTLLSYGIKLTFNEHDVNDN